MARLDIGSDRLALTSLSLDELGLLDVGAGGVSVVAGGITLATFRQRLTVGRNGGSWNGGFGIVSSVAAEDVAAGTLSTVGWLDDGSAPLTFAFAAPGDTNLDGLVDVLDAANFISSGVYNAGVAASWMEGDFNDDGIVDVLDAANFISSGVYDAGVAASWMEGNSNDDGIVDVLDAAAFMGVGLYETGSYMPSPSAAARRKSIT